MNAFEDFYTEDISLCPVQEQSAGLRTRLYYASVYAFEKLELPTEPYTAENFIIKKDDLKFKQFRGWSFFDALIDEADLTGSLSGSARRKKKTSSLSVYLLGFTAENLRKIQNLANEPLVFLIIDNAGQQWIFGNLRNYAQIEKTEGGTGKKYEDNSGFSVSLSTRTTVFPVEGNSTQFYVGPNYIWVLADNNAIPIIFDNNTLIKIN